MAYLQQVVLKSEAFKDFDYNNTDSLFVNAIGYEGIVSMNIGENGGLGVVFNMVNDNNHVFHLTFPMVALNDCKNIIPEYMNIDNKIMINSCTNMNYDTISILIYTKDPTISSKYKYYYIVKNTQTNKFAKIFLTEKQTIAIKTVLDIIAKSGTPISYKDFSLLIKRPFNEPKIIKYTDIEQMNIIKVLYRKKSNLLSVIFTIKNEDGEKYLDTKGKYFVLDVTLDRKLPFNIKKYGYFTSNINEFLADEKGNPLKDGIYYCTMYNMCELDYRYKPYGGGSGPANSKIVFSFDSDIIEMEKYEFNKLYSDLKERVHNILS